MFYEGGRFFASSMICSSVSLWELEGLVSGKHGPYSNPGLITKWRVMLVS